MQQSKSIPSMKQSPHGVAAHAQSNQPVPVLRPRQQMAAAARIERGYATGEHLPTPPLLCTLKETCRLLSIGTTKTYELMNSGELKSTVVGGRRLVYYASILQLAGLADQDAA